jgi:hypothetical protein
MLRRVRQKLRLINYYSAKRRDTAWDRAGDAAFFASFFLCLPIALLMNFMVVKRSTAIDITGRFVMEQGRLTAPISRTDSARSSTFAGQSLGNFHLTIKQSSRGWPLTTSIVRLPPRLDVDILSEVKPRTDVVLPADDPYRTAIERTLLEETEFEALEAFQTGEAKTRQQWIGWLVAAGVWWIMLAIGSSIVIGLVRFATLWVHSKFSLRKAQMRAEGKCSNCGYDMQGLEFNEKCPECGELVW